MQDARIITVHQDTRCKETGKELRRGERALFDPYDNHVYHISSPQAANYLQSKPKLIDCK